MHHIFLCDVIPLNYVCSQIHHFGPTKQLIWMITFEAIANGGPKRQPNSVLVSVTLKNDAIGSEKPNANALHLGDSVPISQ